MSKPEQGQTFMRGEKKRNSNYFTLIPFCFFQTHSWRVQFTLYIPIDIYSFEFHMSRKMLFYKPYSLISTNTDSIQYRVKWGCSVSDMNQSMSGQKWPMGTHAWVSIAAVMAVGKHGSKVLGKSKWTAEICLARTVPLLLRPSYEAIPRLNSFTVGLLTLAEKAVCITYRALSRK